jgi:hypothetical protein
MRRSGKALFRCLQRSGSVANTLSRFMAVRAGRCTANIGGGAGSTSSKVSAAEVPADKLGKVRDQPPRDHAPAPGPGSQYADPAGTECRQRQRRAYASGIRQTASRTDPNYEIADRRRGSATEVLLLRTVSGRVYHRWTMGIKREADGATVAITVPDLK